jgi:glycine betaine/proline transport system ATP-binding protein
MEPIRATNGALEGAPQADESADLDALIDLSVGSETPIVITEGGAPVGVVTKETLLRGIQGGKA